MLDRRVRRGDDVKGLKKSGIFYTEIGILNVKSLNLGPWLYIIGLLIWVKGLLHWHSPHIYVAIYIIYNIVHIFMYTYTYMCIMKVCIYVFIIIIIIIY